MRDIGKNIKELRQKKDLTQEEFAELLFVTRQTVSNYENGKTRPDVDMILKIAQVLDTDANTVFYGLPRPTEKKRAYRALISGAILLGSLVAIFLLLLPLEASLQRRYIISLTLFLRALLAPVIALVFGWLLLHSLSLAAAFKSPQARWFPRAGRIVLCALCILLLFTLLFIFPIFSNLPRFVSACCYSVLILNTKATPVYALLGMALRLFRSSAIK